jgi:hexosaminidase
MRLLPIYSAPSDNKEAYQLSVKPNQISINASNPAGIFYGIQTLLRLLPLEKNASLSLPCVDIDDEPQYKWRGMHLDCSRTFSKNEVKKYIDYLAMYKLNVFHWHLVDDQGWRIEIKKYPLLPK